MRLGLLFLFLAVPLVELALLIRVGQDLGVWATLALVIGTAVAGSLILHRQSWQVMNRAMESAARGQPPVEPVIDGAFLLFAGGLLLTPGLITDALGFALLVPQVRRRVARWLFNLFLANADVVIDVRTHGPDDDRRRPSGHGVVIDGDYETVDEPERKKPRP